MLGLALVLLAACAQEKAAPAATGTRAAAQPKIREGAVASGRPLTRVGQEEAVCHVDEKDRPFGFFFVREVSFGSGKPSDVLAVCTGDTIAHDIGEFDNFVTVRTVKSKTIHAALLGLPDGSGVLVTVAEGDTGTTLVCGSSTKAQDGPVTKPCTLSGVVVRVPDAQKPAQIEVTLADGTKESHTLAELVLP